MKPRFRLRRAPLPGDASPDAPPEARAGYVLEPVTPAAGGPVDEAMLAALSEDIDATLDDELFPTLTEVIGPETAADLDDITDLTDILDLPDDVSTGAPLAAEPSTGDTPAKVPGSDSVSGPVGSANPADSAGTAGAAGAEATHRANWDAALQRTQTELLERLLQRSDELIDVQLKHALAAELAGRCDELVAETRERFDRLAADLQSALGSMVSELVVRLVEDELDRMRAAPPTQPPTLAPTAPPAGSTAPTSSR